MAFGESVSWEDRDEMRYMVWMGMRMRMRMRARSIIHTDIIVG